MGEEGNGRLRQTHSLYRTFFRANRISGVVFAGATDGYVRAYDTATGKVLWRFDTAREFETLNGVVAKGGGVGRNSIMIANGIVYVGSGFGKLPGNVLLAFIGRDRQP